VVGRFVSSGASENNVGGTVEVVSGVGAIADSGPISVSTARAGFFGKSGPLSLFTGESQGGNTGGVSISTGRASLGRGGSFTVVVGEGDSYDGGKVELRAGSTTDAWSFGGKVRITAAHLFLLALI
jgi:hypothetical protein